VNQIIEAQARIRETDPTSPKVVGAFGRARRWRINVAGAVVLSDARKKSDDLTTATVPAGTTFPPCYGNPMISLCARCHNLLRRPVELSPVDPHTSVAPVANGPPLSSDAATIEGIGRRVSAKKWCHQPLVINFAAA